MNSKGNEKNEKKKYVEVRKQSDEEFHGMKQENGRKEFQNSNMLMIYGEVVYQVFKNVSKRKKEKNVLKQ